MPEPVPHEGASASYAGETAITLQYALGINMDSIDLRDRVLSAGQSIAESELLVADTRKQVRRLRRSLRKLAAEVGNLSAKVGG